MKLNKKFFMGGIIVACLAIAGAASAAAFSNKDVLFRQTTANTTKSYTLHASDFSDATSFSISGETWNFPHASVVGDTVIISDVFYTNTRSGSSKSGNIRGDGYTRMTFTGLDVSSATGLVFHTLNVNGEVVRGGNQVESDVDLTFGGELGGTGRRGIHYAQAEKSSFSFTSLTMYYECAEVSPSVNIKNETLIVNVDDNEQVQAESFDIFGEDTVSYAWSSDDETVATVSGNSLTGTIHGVAAGTANITITMTVNGTDFTSSKQVTVSEVPATIKNLKVLSSSRWNGAGLYFDVDPSSAGTTNAVLSSLTSTTSAVSTNSNTGNCKSVGREGSQTDSNTRYFLVWDGAPINQKFSVTLTIKDNVNHIHYVGVGYFQGSNYIGEFNFDGQNVVYETESIELTAVINNGETFSALQNVASSDTNVATVSVNNNIVTVEGVAEGTATITAQVTTVEGNTYSTSKEITVAHKESGLVDFGLSCLSTYGGAYGRIAYEKNPFAEQYSFDYYTVNEGAHQTFHVADYFDGKPIYQMYLGTEAHGSYTIIFYNTSGEAYGTGSFNW